MKVILASPRGFCAGVNMAVTALERALELYGAPLYVYHEIVHNHHVVKKFRDSGVVFVDDLNTVPEGSRLLFSAHGVSPAIRQTATDRKLISMDATCPLVTKVHLEAIRFAEAGYQMVLVGHAGHDEVIGTMGEAPAGLIHLIEKVEDIEKLVFSPSTKLAYLTQTTLSVDDAEVIIKALKEKFPAIQGPAREDICYATQNRQQAVRSLVPQADVVLVLGSQNSSNSQRLAELAQTLGKPAYLIDDVTSIRSEWFTEDQTVLVTAGASAPEWVVQECLGYFREKFQASVEERILKEEKVKFALPKELRSTDAAREQTICSPA